MTKPIVLKFGGTSVGTAERIERVARIVAEAERAGPVVVVVSAMGGVTSDLAEAAERAARGDDDYREILGRVSARHEEALMALLPENERAPVGSALAGWSTELGDRLHGVSLVGECTPRTLDAVLSYGERVSATLVAATLRGAGVAAEACDARALIVTDGSFGGARVDAESTARRVAGHFAAATATQVVTGFIAATSAGETTTLGRGGSDFTAALLGAELGAERIEIWTDVDGVMSSDPRLVPAAFSIPALSYDELMELSHFGAKVVHPPSVHPAREHGIPLVIRNTFNVDFPGTWVTDEAASSSGPVRGISSINDVALLRLEGDGMVGVPGVAARLFQALARHAVNVILISQASSEHSICFALAPAALGTARSAVEDEFRLERAVGLIDDLVVEEARSIVAVVGEAMRDTPGIAGRLFSVLGDSGVNVHAIAQGSSELNISLVVAATDEVRALESLHRAFFGTAIGSAAGHLAADPDGASLLGARPRLFLAGVGQVGAALLAQLRTAQAAGDTVASTLRVVGIADSRRALVDADELSLADWSADLAGSELGSDAVLAGALASSAPGSAPPAGRRAAPAPSVFVDCTASAAVAARYEDLLAGGVSVVAANKQAFSGPLARYRVFGSRLPGKPAVYFETTVGAGLPVLRTITDLVATGDRIVSIEGVFSGTLGFLLGSIMEGRTFSAALTEARDSGYTEPDPRDDLSGQDVARKLLIAGRAAGFALEPTDIEVEPLVPDEPSEGSVDDFMAGASTFDADFTRRRSEAIEHGEHLCYLGSVSPEGGRVALTSVGTGHPCHGLSGTDNVVLIRSRRYPSPIVVRGPGAGPEVTAAGVLVDVLAAVRESTLRGER